MLEDKDTIEKLKDLHDELAIDLNLATIINEEYPRLDIHKDKLRLLVKVLRYVIDTNTKIELDK